MSEFPSPHRIVGAALLLLAATALPLTATFDSPALAAGKSEGKGGGKPEHAGKPAKSGQGPQGQDGRRSGQSGGVSAGEVAIAVGAAALIQSFFAQDLPPGYRLPEPLPPGIRKNLARGKPLPPGIAKKQLPRSLLGRLPHYDGHEYYLVGRDVVLVALATGIVVDILVDAL